MRTWIVMLVLALAVTAVGQSPSAPAPAAGAQPPAAPQQKVIQNTAEYNAYMSATQQANDNSKAVALEGFLQQYPNSVVKADALDLLMATYQKLNNPEKTVDAAKRLVQVDPGNWRALALLTYVDGQKADPQSQAEAQQYAQNGLKALQAAPKPDGMSDADFQQMKKTTGTIFNGTIGKVALQNKDYATAQKYLQESVDANPANLQDVYPLALAYMQAAPPVYPQGIWYLARAAGLAAQNPPVQQQISKYGRSSYVKYHGSDDGWDKVLQAAAASPNPPGDLATLIKPAPTPAEEAAQLVATKEIKDMSFDDFQTIFTSGNQDAIDKVWNEIKDKPIQFQAKVVSVTPTKLTLSATADDIEKKIVDVTLNMVAPIAKADLPKVDDMQPVEGVPDSYTTQPFSITMSKGTLFAKAKPAATKPPAAHRARAH
jgi:tetratricopeptide (TPR) repeat protein